MFTIKPLLRITPAIVRSIAGLTECEKPAPTEKPVRPVLSQLVKLAADWRESTYAGEIKAQHETPLSFRIVGKIIDRRVYVGDTVAAGATLAQIDPSDYDLELVEAEAKVAAARAERSKAHKDLQRYEELLKKKLVSKADFSDYSNKLSVTGARLRQSEAELEVTRNQVF
jgi:multidrug efflux pump subunit AcrA (membrane-fusion protein)